MRDREILLFELNIVAACNKETQLAWFNSLEPEEREIIDAWFEETMERVSKVMQEFKSAIEQGMTAIQKFLDGLSPIILEHIRKVAEQQAEGDDAEDTS